MPSSPTSPGSEMNLVEKMTTMTFSPNTRSGDTWASHLSLTLTRSHPDKPALSPMEHDLLCDKYAPRSFAHAASGLSSTFQQVGTGGSFVGSPPRTRDKFIVEKEKVQYVPWSRKAPSPWL